MPFDLIVAIALAVYAALVAALLWAELRRARRVQYYVKPIAALGFCLMAILCGAAGTAFGLTMLAALMLCAIGDIALLPRDNEAAFKVGMAAFGLAHIVYATGFAQMGINPVWALCGAAAMAVTSVMTLASLRAHAPASMQGPLTAYTVIISLMVVTAIGTQALRVIIPAIMFAVSDVFVARDRFVKHDPKNAIVISPLYFGAQALFALST